MWCGRKTTVELSGMDARIGEGCCGEDEATEVLAGSEEGVGARGYNGRTDHAFGAIDGVEERTASKRASQVEGVVHARRAVDQGEIRDVVRASKTAISTGRSASTRLASMMQSVA